MPEKGGAQLPDLQVAAGVEAAYGPLPATVPFLERLNGEERAALLGAAQLQHCPADTVICREGDMPDALYLIQDGQAAVLKEVEGGRSVLLGYGGPGEILGEISLVAQQPRTASIVTVKDTSLLRIAASEFPRLAADYPGISRALLSVLSDRLQEADLARTSVIQQGRGLAQRLEMVTGEAERLAEIVRVRKETLELVVHDLRTPLTVIDGCLDMIRLSLPNDTPASVLELLEIAQRSSRRLTELSESLLETARREATTEEQHRAPLNIAGLLEYAVECSWAMARGRNLELQIQIPPDLPHAYGDRVQVQRVLDNLLENAMSYTPSGGRIVVAAMVVDGEMQVSVTDTGPGIPAQHRQAIFERFFRLPDARAARQGLGLGLYFCRQVIQAHGGRIWVEPGPENVGSRFVFSLPLAGTKERTHA